MFSMYGKFTGYGQANFKAVCLKPGKPLKQVTLTDFSVRVFDFCFSFVDPSLARSNVFRYGFEVQMF